MTNRRFDRLFGGPPRAPEAPIEPRHMDLAASVQQVTEEVVMRMAHEAHRETKSPHLVLAGGVALNCVANGRLLREGPFQDVWVQPAADGLLRELWAFLKVNKKWWMLPIIVLLLLLGVLVLLSGTGLAPFICTLF